MSGDPVVRTCYCSFCGASEHDETTKWLVEGPGAICVCDKCIVLCNDILKEQGIPYLPAEVPVTEKTETAVLNFLNDLRDPEALGHAVTTEVRQKARDLSRAMLREMEAKDAGR